MPRSQRVKITPELIMPDREDPERHIDLSTLFAPPNVQALNISVGMLRPNPFQPRQEFEASALEELAAGIKANGFLGTLLARPAGEEDGVYELAYGERRWRASKLAGLQTVPVIVRPLTDRQMLEIAITENVLREDLNPLEEAQGYRQMIEMFGYSTHELPERIGKTRSYIMHRLRILKAPAEVQLLVRERPETLRYVAPLNRVTDPAIRAQLVDEIRSGQLISDDIEARAEVLGASGGTETSRKTEERSRKQLRRDRLSTAHRALSHLLGSKRPPADEESVARMREMRDMLDSYLHRWEGQGGSRVNRNA